MPRVDIPNQKWQILHSVSHPYQTKRGFCGIHSRQVPGSYQVFLLTMAQQDMATQAVSSQLAGDATHTGTSVIHSITFATTLPSSFGPVSNRKQYLED